MRVLPGSLIGAALGLAGCGTSEAAGTARAAIVFGDPSPSPGADDAVLLLRHSGPDGDHICSATLLAPNLVVTARHCVAELVHGGFFCSREGALVDNPDGGGTLGLDLPAETLEFHTGELPDPEPIALGAEVHSSLSPSICSNDIAFVVLDRVLDLPHKPIRLLGGTSPGELVTLVGYGLTENPSPDWRQNPRRRITGREVSDVGPDSIEDGVLVAPPRQLLLEGPSACFGDSGGPALSERSDAVIGVYSVASGPDCTSPDVLHHFTHVAPFDLLAERAFQAAGAEPELEPAPEPEPPPDAGCPEPDGCADPPAPRRAESSGCALARAHAAPPSRTGLLALILLAVSAVRRADRWWRLAGRARS